MLLKERGCLVYYPCHVYLHCTNIAVFAERVSVVHTYCKVEPSVYHVTAETPVSSESSLYLNLPIVCLP